MLEVHSPCVYAVNEWESLVIFQNPDDKKEWYGIIEESTNTAFVLGTILHDTLEKAGYNHRKTM